MEIVRTSDFLKDLEELPVAARRMLHQQESRFMEDWLDPRLHTKRLKDMAGAYSFRVTRKYRVLLASFALLLGSVRAGRHLQKLGILPQIARRPLSA